MGRQVKRSRGAPLAPAVEYISPAPAVILSVSPVLESSAPAPGVFPASSPVVEYFAPTPAMFPASSPVVEYFAPTPAMFPASSPVVEYIAPVPAVFQASSPVFPLSPDASDMSSPEDVYKHSWESLPVPIKSFTQVESAEPLNLASETPTVFHGRELLAVSRDWVSWLRKEAARQGYAWRKRRRAQQLCSLRAACVPPGGVVGGEALRLAPLGAGILVETLRELATRGTSTSPSGRSFGEGAGARVAVRSLLGHETAILELETRVEEMEKRLRDSEPFVAVVAQLVEAMQQLEGAACSALGVGEIYGVGGGRTSQEEESRVTNLEQWNHDVAESVNAGVNAVEGRVVNLERWGDDIAESLNAVQDRVENLVSLRSTSL